MADSAAAVSEMVSPFFRPREMSSIRNISAGRQRPEKSTLPLERRGAGAFGAAGGCARMCAGMTNAIAQKIERIRMVIALCRRTGQKRLDDSNKIRGRFLIRIMSQIGHHHDPNV